MVAAAAGELAAERRLALLHCVLSHHGPEAGPGRARQGAGAAARGFGSAEALALYRLNALDASVKGALEHGLWQSATLRSAVALRPSGRLRPGRSWAGDRHEGEGGEEELEGALRDGVRDHDPARPRRAATATPRTSPSRTRTLP